MSALICVYEKYREKIPLFILLFVVTVWALLYFNKYAFVSEGWFFTYADMILEGRVPYRDFEMVFPPLYPLIITMVQAIFGHNLIAFRILGVIMVILMVFFLYKIFSLVTNEILASVAALFSFFILQSQESFLSYDYVNFYQLFYYVAFYNLAKMIKISIFNNDDAGSCEKEILRCAILTGLFVSLSMLCRQSSGIIIFAFIFVTLLLSKLFKIMNCSLKKILLRYLVSFLVPILIFVIIFSITGSLSDFIHCIFFSETKGSTGSMLFSWIKPIFTDHKKEVFAGVITTAVVLLCLIKSSKASDADKFGTKVLSVTCLAVVFAFIFVTYNSLSISNEFVSIYKNPIFYFFTINCILLVISLVMVIYNTVKGKKTKFCVIMCLLFTGFSFALEFGAGTSATITRNEGAIMVGFIFLLSIFIFSKVKIKSMRPVLKKVTFAFVILLIVSSISVKVVAPYAFGGEYVVPHTESIYETDIPYFQYMKLNESEKNCYEDFVSLSSSTLDSSDEIYCFCQYTLFYQLSHKTPMSGLRASSPWIDIASDNAVLSDLDLLKTNCPKMILYTDYGDYFWETMEDLFRDGNDSGQKIMNHWLNECRDGAYGYHLEKVYTVDFVKINVLIRS